VTAHGSTVTLPRIFASVLAEGELAVVIKARAKNLTPATAAAAILGYSIINDLSGRDSTLAVVPPAAKKSADGFAPLGPWLDLAAELRHFTIRTTRNGEVVQEGSTRDLLFSVVECLCHITSILTLEPSDVVAMGTPPPKPKLVPGDEVSVTLSGLGTLTNRIA
jgi:2-keto-4-pentenoate hydratase/2-oxohepta-3-ene-1,7-dioic acid hydratase in catechol pathway